MDTLKNNKKTYNAMVQGFAELKETIIEEGRKRIESFGEYVSENPMDALMWANPITGVPKLVKKGVDLGLDTLKGFIK